jgi:hypothetical protein
MFKFKITPDRHNAIQKLKYCVLPHPAHFSLPSTFKLFILGRYIKTRVSTSPNVLSYNWTMNTHKNSPEKKVNNVNFLVKVHIAYRFLEMKRQLRD